MDSTTADIIRCLQNIIRLGTVAEVDYASPPRVRVVTGELTTDWLPWSAGRAGETRKWDPISIGEQVIIFSPGGDLSAGIVIPALYSNRYPAPSNSPTHHTTHYPDGAVIEYDHAAHALKATLPGGSATVTANTVTSDAPQTVCTGNLLVKGSLQVAGKSDDGSSMTIAGTVKAEGDVIASGVSLVKHVHPGIQPGGSNTGAPQ